MCALWLGAWLSTACGSVSRRTEPRRARLDMANYNELVKLINSEAQALFY